MKKWYGLIIVILIGIAIFGITKKEPPSTGKNQSQKTVVLINGGPKETDKYGVQRLKEEIARFNQVYPNIEIRWTDRDYSPDSFSTSMAGGTAEDVITIWATEGYVIDQGYALDLTAYINQWDYKSQLNEAVLVPFKRQDKIYALPINGYIMGLVYNKKLFKEAGLVDSAGQPQAPENWDEFVATAKKLTNRQKNIAGFGIMGNGAEAGWGLLNWIWQAGGDFEKNENGQWKAVFNQQKAVSGLQFVKDLRWKHDVLQSNVLATSQDLAARFAAGQIGMMFAAQDRIPGLINQYGMKFEDIGMALLPEGPGGRANQMGGNYYIINPKSSKAVQDAAFKWITWRIVGTMEPERVKEKGEDLRKQGQVGSFTALPIFVGETDQKARRAAQEYQDVLVDYSELWKEASKYMRPEPPFFSQQLYSEYLGPAIQAVLTQKNADPQKIFAEAAANFEQRFLRKVQ